MFTNNDEKYIFALLLLSGLNNRIHANITVDYYGIVVLVSAILTVSVTYRRLSAMERMELTNVVTNTVEGDACPGSPWPSSADSSADGNTKPEAGDNVLEQPKDKKKIYKIIVIGDTNVGKTCLTYRFCSGKFPEKTEATIGVDFREKWVDVGGESVKVSQTGHFHFVYAGVIYVRARTLSSAGYSYGNSFAVRDKLNTDPNLTPKS